MSEKNDFSNIDDILAEFSSFSTELINQETKSEPDETAVRTEAPAAESFKQDYIPAPPPLKEEAPRECSAPLRNTPPASGTAAVRRPAARPLPENDDLAKTRMIQPAPRRPRPAPPMPAADRSAPARRPGPRPAARQPEPQEAEFRDVKPSGKRSRPAPELPVKEKKERAVMGKVPAGIMGFISAVLSVLLLCWVFVNVHPYSGARSANVITVKANIIEKFDNFVNNTASDALGDQAYIPKIYTIDEGVTVAPRPSADRFGSTTDPAVVMELIDSAALLLDGQETVFSADTVIVPGSQIQYYLDDTILAITWQEDMNGKLCTCSEVKIAHGSQIRRKLADDTFNSGRLYYASEMAKQCNSVVAINGDFYGNRQKGIVAYNRELYRFTTNDLLESCSFTSSGDMIFSHAGELYSEEYARQFIQDNDIIFTISFGPIIIENGEIRDLSLGYPIGEINSTHSRTGIAQMGKLHYFTMNINYGLIGDYNKTSKLSELADFMYAKGCRNAYTLDGGQTSEVLMNGEPVNYVDWGNERIMSDIIYFATAIPEEEAAP